MKWTFWCMLKKHPCFLPCWVVFRLNSGVHGPVSTLSQGVNHDGHHGLCIYIYILYNLKKDRKIGTPGIMRQTYHLTNRKNTPEKLFCLFGNTYIYIYKYHMATPKQSPNFQNGIDQKLSKHSWQAFVRFLVIWRYKIPIPSGNLLQFAVENDPVEIVDLPIENGGSFHSYVNVYQAG